jgi:gluconolactonase
MRPHFLLFLPVLLLAISPSHQVKAAEPEFPLTEDSKPQPNVPKGEMIKDTYTSAGEIFPGTQREYQLYIPDGLDRSKPAAFMVFQDGVIYQAPVVFDNLISKKDIPPLVGVFIKPGVVPAANGNALPRFNRSYEYDSITDNYSRFLIEEFLHVIETKHGIKLSTDPNDAAISGNSSGGIAAFMVAWHRPDRFRRVFTGVGTYVGIHGGDRLPVLVRKLEPKPIRIFLQSGTGDNNLYCGDWWMANQMMERSFTWAGYDVNHAWGEGGHNQKHASQIFPDVLRWLWRDWQTNREIKANAKGESKWKGYEVVADPGNWDVVVQDLDPIINQEPQNLTPDKDGNVLFCDGIETKQINANGKITSRWSVEHLRTGGFTSMAFKRDGTLVASLPHLFSDPNVVTISPEGSVHPFTFPGLDSKGADTWSAGDIAIGYDDRMYIVTGLESSWHIWTQRGETWFVVGSMRPDHESDKATRGECHIALSADQTLLFVSNPSSCVVQAVHPSAQSPEVHQDFYELDADPLGRTDAHGMCVDTDGRLYVCTSLGVQVCDQAGRVNFIIPTPQQPYDVCFGGKDLSDLFIITGKRIYKRPTKVHGIVSGQMPPIKPAAPKL